MNKNKGAFTLAEVLITLGIIGIVASMTLPALITRNQNKALEASLKKNYSVLQQSFDMYQAEHGERLKPEIIGKHELKSAIIKYFSVLIDCGFGAGDADKACIPAYEVGNENYKGYYKTYNKNIMRLALLDDGQFILKDGSTIFIENFAENVVFISVDVNGYRKNPNQWGHDLFTFQLMKDGSILPAGAPETLYNNKNTYCSATSTNSYNGVGCTYYAINDKDYFNNLPR